jgi:hypothetical protein
MFIFNKYSSITRFQEFIVDDGFRMLQYAKSKENTRIRHISNRQVTKECTCRHRNSIITLNKYTKFKQ